MIAKIIREQNTFRLKARIVLLWFAPRCFILFLFFILERLQLKIVPRSQSNESQIIDKYISENSQNGLPIKFYEFGIGPTEFNFARLSKRGLEGVVVDSNELNSIIARKILHHNTKVENRQLVPEDLKEIDRGESVFMLSIDVDGNDYEFAEVALRFVKPDLLIVEFNRFFGTKRLKVPYVINFNRKIFDSQYHGASFLSFVELAHIYGYHLFAISQNKVNLFFSKNLKDAYSCADEIERGLKICREAEKSVSKELQRFRFDNTTPSILCKKA